MLLILRIIQRDIINVRSLHVKFAIFFSDFNEAWSFWTDFLKILKYQVTWKIGHVEAELFHGDGQTDMTKVTGAFRKIAQQISLIHIYRRLLQHVSNISYSHLQKARIYGLYVPCAHNLSIYRTYHSRNSGWIYQFLDVRMHLIFVLSPYIVNLYRLYCQHYIWIL